ncbi:DUF3253 domain-containing protein [Novosphingobium sp. PS1R-30]|uniref:DUF3253 domain-containing protein n=1 Tax=Novosphingobium anseongense TaxID=3133436 RepID=A0ABU8RUH4_9SPHN
MAAKALLAARAPSATVCPSEVARVLAREIGRDADWKDLMPIVHEAVDAMVEEEALQLSWKGALLNRRTGPYRIGRVGAIVDLRSGSEVER